MRGRFEVGVVALVAGAGFGKTTLLRQALADNVASPRGIDVSLTCGPADARAEDGREPRDLGHGPAVTVGSTPLSRYWLIPTADRPKIYAAHPAMSPDEIRQRTQATWDAFYSLPLIWNRSKGCVKTLRARVMFVLISKLYRQMYANTGIATDSARVARSARRARVLARLARKLFVAQPMPDLEVPLPRLVAERPALM